MIVKCQRSLESSDGVQKMLFYNRARDWQWFGEITPEWDERFGPNDGSEHANKFFAEVRWSNCYKPPEFVRSVGWRKW